MRKTFWFWMSFVLSIVLAVYFATRMIMTSMGHGSNAVIKTVIIHSDSGNRNLSTIASAIGIAPGTGTYSINLDDVNARISNIPGVKLSAVRRMPNGNLSVKVKMHKAVALWADGDSFYPVSGDGIVINRPLDNRPENTVLFRGTLPPEIEKIAKIAQNFTQYIDYLEWIEDRRWNMYTNGGTIVMLPENDPYAAISNIMIINKNHNILSKKIQLLDMRDAARILVKY